MKNLNFSFRSAAIIATTCLTLSFGSLFMQNHFQGKTQKMSALSSGVGICFTRITQTFTALMIQDFSSVYMKPTFMGDTGECFNIANSEFNLLWGKAFKDGYKYINQIVSDLHWYHEKTQKLQKMVTEGGVSLANSNIINKYSSLETAKNNFTDAVDKKIEENQTWTTAWFALSFISFAFFMMTAAGFGVQVKKRKETFDLIENEVSTSSDLSAAKIDRILENIFGKLQMPQTYQAINNYYSNLLEKQYADFEKNDEIPVVSPKMTPKKVPVISADFHTAMSSALESMQTKALSHGIMLEADLNDEFRVKGEQEAVDQFVYNLVNYAADNSLASNEGRKISFKSNALGATAYLKIKVSNYCFNATELNFLNSGDQSFDDVNMNLIIIKELLSDIGATLAVKNKTSATQSLEGCEMEVVFERVLATEAIKEVKVVKGTKAQILRSMHSEA